MIGPRESATIVEGEPFLCIGVNRLHCKHNKRSINLSGFWIDSPE